MKASASPLPRALRKARLGNLVLVPASLLPYKEEYQALANQQPSGTTLIVLPTGDSHQRQTLETVARRLQAEGKHVSVVVSACIGVN